jgi:predicted transcriptional regulator
MNIMGRRQRFDIIADILKIAAMGTKKTRLVYLSNLNFTILKDYLDLLLKKELIELSDEEYCTTLKGFLFLEKYVEIQKLLKNGKDTLKNEIKAEIQDISLNTLE